MNTLTIPVPPSETTSRTFAGKRRPQRVKPYELRARKATREF